MNKAEELLTIVAGGICVAGAMIGVASLVDWATRPSTESYIQDYTQRVTKVFIDLEGQDLPAHQKYMRLCMELTCIRFDVAVHVQGDVEAVRAALDSLIIQLKEEYGYTTV